MQWRSITSAWLHALLDNGDTVLVLFVAEVPTSRSITNCDHSVS